MYCGVHSRYPSGQRRRRRSRFVRIGRKSGGVNGLGVCRGLDSGFGPSTRWPTSRAGRRSRVAAAAVAAGRCWPCIAFGLVPGVARRSRRWCTVTASGFPGAVRLRCPSQRGRGCYPRAGSVLGVCRPRAPAALPFRVCCGSGRLSSISGWRSSLPGPPGTLPGLRPWPGPLRRSVAGWCCEARRIPGPAACSLGRCR